MFEWLDFLELAEVLAARPNDEAAARMAISRAYYAAFYVGCDYLLRADIPLDRSRNAHLQVQGALREQSTEITQHMEQLHFWRKRADYDAARLTDFHEQARSVLSLARETIDAVKAIS